MDNTYQSNRTMFFWYRYSPLLGVVLILLAMLNDIGRLSFEELTAHGIGLAIFFLFFLLAKFLVFSAAVNAKGITLNNKSQIPWTEIVSINRLGNLYIVKTRGSIRIRFFPIEDFYNPFLGKRVEDDDMDQLIDIMMEKKPTYNA